MKLIFAGTPDFAERALSALHAAGYEIALVLSRPDQPAGRGQKLQASPVKQRALALDLPVAQPRTLRDPDAQALLAAVGADAMIVAAYGLILPPAVLAIPRLGCINIHASLLPRWRGAAPIQRAIEAGDTETGITIMRMDAGLDTGPMLLERALPIGPDDTGGQVHDRLAALGATMIVEALDGLAAGRLSERPQPDDGATYAAKIGKTDAVLDWTLSAAKLAAKIRAFDPFPGATARLVGRAETLKIWSARADADARTDCDARVDRTAASACPGEVVFADERTLAVLCGGGTRLRLVELQKPGGRRMPVAEFLRGYPVPVGARFELSAPGG
jgi:methionyl-tRNA formyltransferase